MRYVYSLAGIVALIGAAMIALAQWLETREPCPRRIKGYSRCKGTKCDHSPETVAQARKDMRAEITTRKRV